MSLVLCQADGRGTIT